MFVVSPRMARINTNIFGLLGRGDLVVILELVLNLIIQNDLTITCFFEFV